MKSFFERISSLIWKKEQSNTDAAIDAENRRNHLAKVTCTIALSSYVLYIIIYSIIDFYYLWPMILNLAVFAIVFVVALVLLRKRKFMSAKILSLFSMTLSIFIGSALLIGRPPGIHIYFFLIALLPIVIWSFDHRGLITFFFLLNISCFFYVEYLVTTRNVLIPFPEEYIILIRSISYIISFIIIALTILLYQKLAENKEKLLLNANKKLKEKTDELTELNNTKDKFFSIIAHDLKNPVGAILKGIELISMNYEKHTDKKRIELIEAVHKTSLSTYELLEKLLEWGKIKTNRLQPHFDNIDLNEVVNEVIELYEKLILDKMISIEIDLEKNLLVYADQYMLSVVVRNLISNAVKFTPKGGSIKILSEQGENGLVDIVFVDSGIGISEQDQKELFKLEKTISRPGTENEKGTGLGLHLCKEYVENVFGRIAVSSTVGEGSRFTVTLRRACE